ncbi:CHRD domain-containing protein [Miltoncostaea marina]|uniref:CHRD domain-containing protein n=1 Tax=Miltoncostaea marina TaxID=2843215 RepID=UPI001C3E4E93|nr:CHRD domain-containing protein [Miltoncostaea marina]
MNRRATAALAGTLAAAAAAAGTVAFAHGGGGGTSVHERLTGYQEDPLVISTSGSGEFHARFDPTGQRVLWRLAYADTEGVVSQAHIHLGGRHQSGGIMAFLCSNLGNGPAGTQPCPPAPATLTGAIEADDVVGPAAQGIAPGEFPEMLRAIAHGVAYANVHSDLHPAGEIRAQLRARGR